MIHFAVYLQTFIAAVSKVGQATRLIWGEDGRAFNGVNALNLGMHSTFLKTALWEGVGRSSTKQYVQIAQPVQP